MAGNTPPPVRVYKTHSLQIIVCKDIICNFIALVNTITQNLFLKRMKNHEIYIKIFLNLTISVLYFCYNIENKQMFDI